MDSGGFYVACFGMSYLRAQESLRREDSLVLLWGRWEASACVSFASHFHEFSGL